MINKKKKLSQAKKIFLYDRVLQLLTQKKLS